MTEGKNQMTDVHLEETDHHDVAPENERRASVAADNVLEHELTFMDVARNHKMLIWWCFYFAMCAVGW